MISINCRMDMCPKCQIVLLCSTFSLFFRDICENGILPIPKLVLLLLMLPVWHNLLPFAANSQKNYFNHFLNSLLNFKTDNFSHFTLFSGCYCVWTIFYWHCLVCVPCESALWWCSSEREREKYNGAWKEDKHEI